MQHFILIGKENAETAATLIVTGKAETAVLAALRPTFKIKKVSFAMELARAADDMRKLDGVTSVRSTGRAQCAVCNRVYPVRKDGTIARHGAPYGTHVSARDAKACKGSGKAPLGMSTTAAEAAKKTPASKKTASRKKAA